MAHASEQTIRGPGVERALCSVERSDQDPGRTQGACAAGALAGWSVLCKEEAMQCRMGEMEE